MKLTKKDKKDLARLEKFLGLKLQSLTESSKLLIVIAYQKGVVDGLEQANKIMK